MIKLIEKEIGPDGIAYVQECLRQGGGLSSKLLELPLTLGKAYALVPEQTSTMRAKSFNVGGLMHRHDTNIWLAAHLLSLWKVQGTGTCILQDVWAKPSDPAVRRTNSKKLFDDENVYYFLQRDDIDLLTMESTIRSLVSYLFIGVFTQYVIQESDISSNYVSAPNVVDAIAHLTKEVFVTAYDQEGLVIWRNS